ncbi:MAG: hypothetical protein CL751_03705 [Chloroflexi bacterium]|nr:hypothetical protein [Chloroflexota bacterium]|tara:strand:- start:5285 stop:6451 length:1167 start_codon:yes stop_codon:yes gene_type:complete
MSQKNVLILQSGGVTSVINRSLLGIIKETKKELSNSRIYASDHGIEGLIKGKTPDITDISEDQLHSLKISPGAALGSSRHKIKLSEIQQISDNLNRHKIKTIYMIGGNDSAETGLLLNDHLDIQIIHIPKTIDNDLEETDHCPGYGSTARFISQASLGSGKDAWSMGDSSPITIIEVMGRDTGWLALASTLYKKDDFDPPHFIGIPEQSFDEDFFLFKIEESYRKFGYAVAVIAENIKTNNMPIGDTAKPWFTDDFGHEYYNSPSKYLSKQVSKRLNLRCRHESPGTIQRSLIDSVSTTDGDEAELVGKSAVTESIKGNSNIMITLIRESNNPYSVTTSTTSLDKIAGKVRKLPRNFYPSEDFLPNAKFIEYLNPLIGTPIDRINRLL